MTALCFGCSGRFERAQLEQVGDTVFCRACLARMLRRVEERGAGSGIARDAPGPAKRPPLDAPCFICAEPLEGAAFVELRGFAICASCSRGLLGDRGPAAPAANDDVPAAPAPPSDELSDEPGEPQALPPVVTPGTGTEWCAGCGRAMPGPGSYQLVDGRPHCTACVAARTRRPEPDEPGRAAPAVRCDACERPVAPATLRETRGFALCIACLDSDAELALALAQAHHRRRLARAGRRLLEDDH